MDIMSSGPDLDPLVEKYDETASYDTENQSKPRLEKL